MFIIYLLKSLITGLSLLEKNPSPHFLIFALLEIKKIDFVS